MFALPDRGRCQCVRAEIVCAKSLAGLVHKPGTSAAAFVPLQVTFIYLDVEAFSSCQVLKIFWSILFGNFMFLASSSKYSTSVLKILTGSCFWPATVTYYLFHTWYRERKCADTTGTVPIQLAQCRFPGLAISYAKILIHFRIKYTKAILSNSTRKLLWFKITRMLVAVLKHKFIVLVRTIFGALSSLLRRGWDHVSNFNVGP